MNLTTRVFEGFKSSVKKVLKYDRNRLTFLRRDNRENELGNLQKDESIFLYGLIKVLRPKTVVEFGFLEGYSSSVILSALDTTSHLHSFDNSEHARSCASTFSRNHSNFSFHYKNQRNFEHADIANNTIDFVLMDASHDLELNKATFQKLKALLRRDAIMMIHDTGLWQRGLMTAEHFSCLESTESKWLDNERVAHQVGERRFVNWITQENTGFATINIGSSNILRHGCSLIGSSDPLEV
jgi:predicted O-methyltransferase YrrM